MEDLALNGRLPGFSVVPKFLDQSVTVVIVKANAVILINFEKETEAGAPVPVFIKGVVGRELEFVLIEKQPSVIDHLPEQGKRMPSVVNSVIVGVGEANR